MPALASGTATVLRDALAAQLDELERTEPGVRRGDDPEAVHDMRVAVRRLRSTLRTVRPLLDRAWTDRMRRDLAWVGDSLGRVRDLDVLLARLEEEANRLDGGDAVVAAALLRPLAARRGDARAQLVGELASPDFEALVQELRRASATPPLVREDVSVEELAAKEFHRLRKRGAISPGLSNAGLHKRRIRIKRARYAAELVASPRSKLRKFIRAAKTAQDTLGEHHDAVVARRELRRLARLSERADVGSWRDA
jgi:CHAD domain-containing protein